VRKLSLELFFLRVSVVFLLMCKLEGGEKSVPQKVRASWIGWQWFNPYPANVENMVSS